MLCCHRKATFKCSVGTFDKVQLVRWEQSQSTLNRSKSLIGCIVMSTCLFYSLTVAIMLKLWNVMKIESWVIKIKCRGYHTSPTPSQKLLRETKDDQEFGAYIAHVNQILCVVWLCSAFTLCAYEWSQPHFMLLTCYQLKLFLNWIDVRISLDERLSITLWFTSHKFKIWSRIHLNLIKLTLKSKSGDIFTFAFDVVQGRGFVMFRMLQIIYRYIIL